MFLAHDKYVIVLVSQGLGRRKAEEKGPSMSLAASTSGTTKEEMANVVIGFLVCRGPGKLSNIFYISH